MRRRHPKRTITREIRTRRPLHPGREEDDLQALTWPESIRVRDRMTRPVTTIHSDALVSGAATLMRSRHIRHLPVVDRGRRLVGIVTDRDLRDAFPSVIDVLRSETRSPRRTYTQPEEVSVEMVMTANPLTLGPEDDLREAARVMRRQRIGAIPIVENHQLLGILTRSDLLDAFLSSLGNGRSGGSRT